MASLSKDQIKELTRLQKQQLDSAHGKAEPLTEAQEEWVAKATDSMINGTALEEAPLNSKAAKFNQMQTANNEGRVPTEKELGLEPDELSTMVEKDVQEQPTEQELPDDPEEAERLIKEDMQTVSESFMKMAEKQGKKEAIQKAIAEYPKGDPYFGTIRGRVIVLRPLYEDEQRKAMNMPDEEVDSYVAKTCTIVGLDDLLTKEGKARAGLYSTIARNVMRISDMSMDMDELIVPVEVE